MFPAAFIPFVEQRPIGVMARAIVERFFEPEHLDALFRRTAIEQYERELLFSEVVDLMQSVVLGGGAIGVCRVPQTSKHASGER